MGVRVRLTGRLEVQAGDTKVDTRAFRGRQGRTAFAYLVDNRARPVPRDELAEVLWPGGLPASWDGDLSAVVSRLRGVLTRAGLDGALPTSGGAHQMLLPEDAWVDVEHAASALASAERHLEAGSAREAADAAAEACDLARAPLLAGDEGPWLERRRRELAGLLADALLVLADARLASDDARGAARAAEEAVSLDAFREAAHQRLIRAHAASGSRAEALLAYERCRRLLSDELGADPSPQTEAVYLEALRARGDATAAVAPAAPLAPAQAGLPSVLADADTSPFAGRRDVVEAMQSSFAGDVRLHVVTGEPGIGKTRTVTEFGRWAHAAGANVLYGRCDAELRVGYLPFVDAIARHVQARPPADAAAIAGDGAPELARLVPALAQRLGDVGDPVSSDPDGDRYRLHTAVAALLSNVSAGPRTVLVLDDMHWADVPSLQLLRHVVRETDADRLLVVATYRDAEASDELAAAVAESCRAAPTATSALRGLGADDARAVAEAAAGTTLSDAQLRRLHDATEGNPLFVREMARALAESGAAAPAVPEGVKAVIGARLRRLDPSVLQVLQVASVIGRDFGLDLLSAVTARTEDQTLDALDAALAVRVVDELPGELDRYTFSHALVRETLYDGLTQSRRVRLHERVASSIVSSSGTDDDSSLAELSYHACAAGPRFDAGAAFSWASRAGERAMLLLSYEEAATHFERALGVLAPEDARRARLLMRLGAARRDAGVLAGAAEALQAALEAARSAGQVEEAGAATLELIRLPAESNLVSHERIGAVQTALDEQPPGDSVLRANLLGRLAFEMYFDPALAPDRAALADEAVAVARRLGDARTLAEALHTRCHATWTPSGAWRRREAASEIVRLAGEVDDPALLVQGHAWTMTASLETGDIAGFDRGLHGYEAVAARLRQPRLQHYVLSRRSMRRALAGDFDEASALARAARETGLRHGEPDAENVYSQMMSVWCERDPSEGIAYMRDGIERLPFEEAVASHWYDFLVALLVRDGRDEEAAEQLRAVDGAERAQKIAEYMVCMSAAMLGEACAALGDERAARAFRARLEPYTDLYAVGGGAVMFWGAVAHHVGVIDARLGEHDSAREHLESARAMHERVSSPPWVARTCFELARLEGRVGRGARARELAAKARGHARAVGMPVLDRELSGAGF